MSEAEIEKEIQEKGKTAPRITPAMIDEQIAGHVTARASDLFKDVPGTSALQCLTICIITTKNGFTLLGKSACASPANYDHEIGNKLAYDDAREQMWPLMGYALREEIADPESKVTMADTEIQKVVNGLENKLDAAEIEIERLRQMLSSNGSPAPATTELAVLGLITIEDIAQACHEINRAFCQAQGDDSQAPWQEAPDWQRESALNGVALHLVNPDMSPSASHEAWLAQKTAEGWKYGKTKDVDKKTHPCFLPYDKLPPEQKAKDYLFKATVANMAPHLDDDERAKADKIAADFKAAMSKNTEKVEKPNDEA